MANKRAQGRGWFGDSEGHAKAGAKGGKARARNRKTAQEMQNQNK